MPIRFSEGVNTIGEMLFGVLTLLSIYQIATDFNFRIHTPEGWFGPETRFNGASGYIRICDSVTKLDNLLSKENTDPIVILLPNSLLYKQNLDKITTKFVPMQNLRAVLIYNDNATAKSETSTESKTPLKDLSADPNNHEWNPTGNGEQYNKFDFPIIYPPYKTGNEIYTEAVKDGEIAGLYVDLKMNSRGDVNYCISQGKCDVIGGQSIIGSFDKKLNDTAVWAIAGIDSFGIAPYAQVGADYSISGFVTLVAALDALKDLKWSDATTPLRFAFFDGEEIGYLGSTRFLKETHNFTCYPDHLKDGYCDLPFRFSLDFQGIKMEDFDTVVEVKSVGLKKDASKIYAHTHTNDKSTTLVNDLIGDANIKDLTIEASTSAFLPPSSANSFVRENEKIRHVVFTGYDDVFVNKNVGKPSDDEYDPAYMTNAATVVAKTLAKLCFGGTIDYSNVKANETLLSGLMQGFVGAANDSAVFHELLPSTQLPTDHVSLYAAVFRPTTIQMKHRVLQEALRDVVSEFNTTKCTEDSNCTDVEGGYCHRSGVCATAKLTWHPAYSLAFEYDQSGKLKVVDDSGKYRTWAEAVWSTVDIKYVKLPRALSGRIICGLGALLCVVSSILGAKLWRANLLTLSK